MKFFRFLLLILFVNTLLLSQNIEAQKSTASLNVSIIEKQFVIPNLNTISHKIWVYLPPNYETSSHKFPVIYMHDAQNLFDSKTSYNGEWNVDESLNELYKNTNKSFIVVGIENGEHERMNEYTPWPNKNYGGGKGAEYIRFIVHNLKPYIDSTYRTKPQQKYTGLIGSSLGGLISYYGGLKYPDIFGKIGALSTSFWFSNQVVDFAIQHGNINNVKMFLLVGEKEGEQMVEGTLNTEKLLLETGFKSKNLTSKIVEEGEHNEAFWRSEFLTVLKWLYNIK